jgi:hypothetical protein
VIINFLIVLLTYLMILVLCYEVVVLQRSRNGNAERIVNKSLDYAFFILGFGLLIVYTLVVLPHIILDEITIAYLLLICKYISVITLGCSIFMLSRRKIDNKEILYVHY